jgi:hypothetical protein
LTTTNTRAVVKQGREAKTQPKSRQFNKFQRRRQKYPLNSNKTEEIKLEFRGRRIIAL